jgi:hypothetical protein
MSRLRLIPFILSVLAVSCDATAPAVPDVNLLGVRVYYSQAMSHVAVGGTASFRAYALSSDGAYDDVTATATWTSGNAQVLSARYRGSFTGVAPGLTEVQVTAGTMTASLLVPVVNTSNASYPRLTFTGGDPQRIGVRAPVTLLWQTSPTSSETVTDRAECWSANSAVAAISGGAVAGTGVGTTVIHATYKNTSLEYGLSVQPNQ